MPRHPVGKAVAAAQTRKIRLMFFVTEDWYFCSHRLPLACAARDAGYQVTVVTRVTDHGDRITGEGFHLIPLDLRRGGSNPLHEFMLIWRLWRILRRERPELLHNVAIKPVIDGSAAAILARVPAVVNAVAGLGYVFSSGHFRAQLLKVFVRLGFRLLLNRRSTRVVLQNPDDQRLLVDTRLVDAERTRLIAVGRRHHYVYSDS